MVFCSFRYFRQRRHCSQLPLREIAKGAEHHAIRSSPSSSPDGQHPPIARPARWRGRERECGLAPTPLPGASPARLGPTRLAVTVMDPDCVSEVNVVRQPFSHVDIGSNKAMCLVGRINMFWGFAWKAIPRYFGTVRLSRRSAILLISCVDTRKARHLICQSFKNLRAPAYHLDLATTPPVGSTSLASPKM